MDHADVDWALLHVDPTLSKDLTALVSYIRAFPDRLCAMAPVDVWLIPGNPEMAIRHANEAIWTHGLHALKIDPEYAYRMTSSRSFNEPSWTPFGMLLLAWASRFLPWEHAQTQPTPDRVSFRNSTNCDCGRSAILQRPYASPMGSLGAILLTETNLCFHRRCGNHLQILISASN